MKFSDYVERKRHGSPDFPIQYYYLDKKNPQYVMRAHWHKEFEVIRVISGKLNAFIDNVEYTLFGGDILVASSGCLHRAIPDDCIYECMVFDLNMLRKQQNDVIAEYILPILNSNVRISSLIPKDDGLLYATINSVFYAMRYKNKYYELDVYSGLFKFFSLMYSQGNIVPTANKLRTQQAEKISALLDWIEVNFAEPVSLKLLAEKCSLSEKYLCKIFKIYTSKTPIEYINELRIENACHEMTVKGHSVTESAISSGFNDLSYFSKLFKSQKGMTPKQYRDNFKKRT